MPADALITLLTQQVITTTAVNGPGYNTLTGLPRRGGNVRILYSGVSAATVPATVTIKQQKSADNTTYIDAVYAEPISISTTAQAGVLDMPVHASHAYPYIRIVVTPSPASSAMTGTYKAEFTAGRPG